MARRRLSRLPRLTTERVANDDALWDGINEVRRSVPHARRRRKTVLRTQEQLRALVSPEAWQVYLALEAATNERHDDEIIAIARWAFAQGVVGRSRGEGS